ncbi:spermidine/putrescine ABC transporter substrate-binding lipoprotein [Pontimonas salivibrio]|uniref:Spermidine/putrescine ABC transporter substrate-binding lipoprotein n=1 Tax=Pontimonas salivibrio TaxID=1159327 RepID=A0A2L2BRA3_9MICO|nr:ABC transporter substrate-binding protein [Pontimonas salivibrio]AVG24196.1 spermidine/putrescine ABC transporter substrate-binding lipoprotein [Pontimonas salivibrio]
MRGNKLAAASLFAASAVVLSACATDSGELTLDVPDVPMIEELGDFEGELNIVNWSGFVEPAWTDQFTADTGCVVNARVAGTSDEMVTLMRTGEYDLVSASGDAALRLIVGGDVQPLNMELIPNFGDDIAEGMKGQIYDTVNGNPYGVPIGRGANLLQYNEDVTGGEPESWDVVWESDSPYAGKITAYDAPIYIADAAVYLMYHEPELGIENPYALDDTQLAAAVDLLKQQNEIIGEYWADPVAQITSFVGGNTVVGTSWEVLRKFADSPNLKTTLPIEGSTGWFDAWLLSTTSPNTACAYAWMDYTSQPDVNGAIAMNFGMAPANLAFCATSEEAQAHCDEFAAEDEAFFDRIWAWTTPIEQCIDGRTDVTCTSFQDWTNAWLTVKG